MTHITGGAAFPTTEYDADGTPSPWSQMPGMTLRDYFAAHAMQAILQVTLRPEMSSILADVSKAAGRESPEQMARMAYGMADTMLTVRLT